MNAKFNNWQIMPNPVTWQIQRALLDIFQMKF